MGFTRVGSMRLDVSAIDGKTVRIVVIGTAIGLAEDQLIGLFSPFVLADSSSARRNDSTGLGLAICEKLANLMGGSIALQRAVEVRFRCTLAISMVEVARQIMVGPGQPALVPTRY
jgi:signal transduction histidine kinase